MGWVTYRNWDCMYADRDLKKSEITCYWYFKNKDGKKINDFISPNSSGEGIGDEKEGKIPIANVGGLRHEIIVAEKDKELNQYVTWCVYSNFIIKQDYKRGDVIAVFTNNFKTLNRPELPDTFFSKLLGYDAYDKKTLEKFIENCFRQLIKSALEKEDKDNKKRQHEIREKNRIAAENEKKIREARRKKEEEEAREEALHQNALRRKREELEMMEEVKMNAMRKMRTEMTEEEIKLMELVEKQREKESLQNVELVKDILKQTENFDGLNLKRIK